MIIRPIFVTVRNKEAKRQMRDNLLHHVGISEKRATYVKSVST